MKLGLSVIFFLISIVVYLFVPLDLDSAILNFRILRMIDIIFVGASLCVSGFVSQTIFRNSLADPFTLGISPFAALGMVFAILFNFPLLGGALAFGLAAGFFILFVGRFAKLHGANLILIGVVFGFFASAIIHVLGNWVDTSYYGKIQAILLGDFTKIEGTASYATNMAVFLGIIFLYFLCDKLDLISLNPDLLKEDHTYFYAKILILLSILISYAVFQAGIVGFIGLIVPHIVKQIFPLSHRKIFPLVILWGASGCLWCDRIGQSFVGNVPMPLGIVAMILGVPIFSFILIKTSLKAP